MGGSFDSVPEYRLETFHVIGEAGVRYVMMHNQTDKVLRYLSDEEASAFLDATGARLNDEEIAAVMALPGVPAEDQAKIDELQEKIRQLEREGKVQPPEFLANASARLDLNPPLRES
jgi:hypothetical protein